MFSPTPDKISRLGRLEGRFVGMAELVLRMREELERHRAEIAELTRIIGAIKEGSVKMSDFLEIRSMVGLHETENVGLRQARLDTSSPTSRVNLLKAADSRCPYMLVTAARCLMFFSFFERGLWRITQKTPLVTSEPIRVVGKDRVELDNTHQRERRR